MSEKELDAIEKFFRAMFDTPVWWYGVSIPDAKRNSLSHLLQVSYHEFVDSMIDVGWMKQDHSSQGEKKEFMAVKTGTITRFIEQSGLSAIAEIARISYKNQCNCCFIHLGTFSDEPPFAALSVVHNPGKAPPPITNTKADKNLRDALQQLQSFFVHNNNLQPQPKGTLQSMVTKIAQVPIHKDTNPSFGNLQNNNKDNIAYQTAQPQDIGLTPITPTEMQLPDGEIEDNIALQTMIQQLLLPTIFKEDFIANAYWQDPSMFGDVASAIGKLLS